MGRKKRSGISVKSHWADGLPTDRMEQAITLKTQVESGVSSRLSALTRILGSESAAREELEKILLEEGLEAAREAAVAAEVVDLEEEGEEQQSESSNRAEAAAKQQIGWRDNEAGRQKKGPKLGG